MLQTFERRRKYIGIIFSDEYTLEWKVDIFLIFKFGYKTCYFFEVGG